MKRGEIWTIAGGKEYAGKPRPAVIIQDDRFDSTASLTVCAFTTDLAAAPLFRVLVAPSGGNGLRMACRLMVDKITTVPKTKLGLRVGRLDAERCFGSIGLYWCFWDWREHLASDRSQTLRTNCWTCNPAIAAPLGRIVLLSYK